jgi:transcriptional regulator with XRE-family HTH domain
MSDVLIDRIKERLATLEVSARSASLRAGLGPDAIRSILNGSSKSPRADTLSALAGALRCDVNYLLGNVEEPGNPIGPPPTDSVPLPLPFKGYIEADAWLGELAAHRRTRFDLPGMPHLDPALEYRAAQQWLEQLNDDTMSLVFPRGTFIHLVDHEAAGRQIARYDFVKVVRTIKTGIHTLREYTLKQYDLDGNGHPILCSRRTRPAWNDIWHLDTNEEEGLHSPKIVALALLGIIVPPSGVPDGYTPPILENNSALADGPRDQFEIDLEKRRSAQRAAEQALAKAELRQLGIEPPREASDIPRAIRQISVQTEDGAPTQAGLEGVTALISTIFLAAGLGWRELRETQAKAPGFRVEVLRAIMALKIDPEYVAMGRWAMRDE